MSNFIQLHFLTSYPPANLNRDDLGRPKTTMFGDAMRLRISSQSLKRAWRCSEVFQNTLAAHLGERTKLKGIKIYEKLINNDIPPKNAKKWAQAIIEQFGKLEGKPDKDEDKEDNLSGLKLSQLVHFSPEENQAIDALVDNLIETKQEPGNQELKLLREQHSAADIACFGRMLADAPKFNTEAAVQVAHAISVHKVAIEDDFFTAVDDLNDCLEDSGAAHLGETEFAAGLFYEYVCIDRDELKKNLQNNEELTQKTIAALVEVALTVAPSGKQNSFASRARASYALVEKGKQQPRSLTVAFLKPVKESDMLAVAIENLIKQREKMNLVYGPCAEQDNSFNVEAGQGSLKDLIDFAKAE
jgi:CRISPR system Cascade subunit CasC